MDANEFASYLKDASDPDKSAEALLKIKDGVDGMFSELENNGKAIKEKDAKIGELRDTNARLFLRATGNKHEDEEQEDDEEKTPEEAFDALIKKIGDEMNK